jgi:hypothetical protein
MTPRGAGLARPATFRQSEPGCNNHVGIASRCQRCHSALNQKSLKSGEHGRGPGSIMGIAAVSFAVEPKK